MLEADSVGNGESWVLTELEGGLVGAALGAHFRLGCGAYGGDSSEGGGS